MKILNRYTGELILEVEGETLEGANLEGANLTRANLISANLEGASLISASLEGASLRDIKKDFFNVLDSAPAEVQGVRLALMESRVDGSAYQGECACLVGTIANIKKCDYEEIPGLRPNANRPAERWFLAITETLSYKDPIVAITIGWIDEWVELHKQGLEQPTSVEGAK